MSLRASTSKKAVPVCCTTFKISDGGPPPIALSPDIGHPVCDALVIERSNFGRGVKECGCSTTYHVNFGDLGNCKNRS